MQTYIRHTQRIDSLDKIVGVMEKGSCQNKGCSAVWTEFIAEDNATYMALRRKH